MSIIEKDKIAAIRREDGSMVCTECTNPEDWKGITEDKIITEDNIVDDHDNIYFCDVCKGEISF